MKRKLINKLLEWNELVQKKPILLTGGKGVGKTHLVLDYAKTFYRNYIYINYELNVNSLNKPNSKSITGNMVLEYISQINSPEPLLIILDEVSFFAAFSNIVNELKSRSQIEIIIISSRAEPELSDKYFTLTLYPLDFEEFLLAINKEWYIGVIKEHFNSNLKIPDIVHSDLLKLCDIYLRIGGMPLAVNEYINTGTEFNVPQIHKLILNAYLSEINYDCQESGGIKAGQILKVLPLQLGKMNKKFQYSLMRKGATKNLYLDALGYVKDTYYAMDCHRINESEEEFLHFKLYFFDTGILNSLSKECEFKEMKYFRKGLIENFVALHLCIKGYSLNFWESESQSKIEFVIHQNDDLLPIEVKVDNNTRSKNLSMYRSKYTDAKEAVKISTRNFSYDNHIKYVPLYAVFCI